ncbi:NAD(P)/FAD-dependent oxidoreductase [Burkholderia glumae]|uniref:NAD(P)/FAD-dependent oxidoreductase n=1 Tax=Burkholderia glumae TaxID=337 RepID=A0AAP9Y3L9_BURGL|nr:NAD(P)/FAD-dependent oxidoreductase [Burkholderia glumae]ACR28270.1 FAD dependent oxidoreductase [Burkholderia glumae BGR1]AJY65172.1 FAD dependent oxidoreductase family protein [Burkholderia glumae LMG 2196 = ATCC 33617]KHJ61366.1 FAD-dependent oxidoreductase [Burkholderia glumae]MCM2480738.1 NAD(P)/FAD-dependent oxidoreductase [Burkholderia glumae]MCM2509123.1 NAD(P)/FAD-dependent oxidoreductase [Burkholderia glumae]
MTEMVDCVVIGAGVVGLAAARASARRGWETVIVESESMIGTGTSSRNSEVIHAGIYYSAGSLKARLCVEGRERLYAFCEEHQVPYRRSGKLIVAAEDAQRGTLAELEAAARANGVTDLRRLSGDQARALEPALRCVAALESPSTGIVDSHALMLALLGDAERAGAVIAYRSPVIGGQVLHDGGPAIELEVGGAEPMTLRARRVVNAAGLYAQTVAGGLRGLPPESVPRARYAKGNYYSLAGRAPFSRLIYPVPEPGGLGVHLTLDLANQARFGPDVEWIDEIDFRVDPARAARFYDAIRSYWPELPDEALQPAYAGVRPKLAHPPGGGDDFVIQSARAHGVAGLVNLYGIESPGLTASLAIAEQVIAALDDATQ